MVIFIVDNNQTNPYEIWQNDGKPNYPSRELLKKMRDVQVRVLLPTFVMYPGNSFTYNLQEPFMLQGPRLIELHEENVISFNLRLPGVALIHICSGPPAQRV